MEGMDRRIEIMAEMLDEQRGMRGEMKAMRKEQELTNQRLGALEKQMVKNNLGIGELRVSVMRLADEIEKIVLLDQRVSKLEDAVFRKSA
jgi:hypothetical protein